MKKLIFLVLILAAGVAMATCPDGKTYPVHFTFDDGPHSVLTPRVLDILREERVPSTFFISGHNLAGGQSNPANRQKYALLDRMRNEGHLIGSHTYQHIEHNSSSMNPSEIRANIRRAREVLRGYETPILRLPYGAGSFRSSNPASQARNDLVMRTVRDEGYTHVGWDVDTNDWSARHRPTLQETMLNQICRNCASHQGGACVVLFHDVHAHTADNLRTWIRAVRSAGHRFVPLSADRRYEEACASHPDAEHDQLLRDIDAVLGRGRNNR